MTATHTYLCVGGPYDGQRMPSRDPHRFRAVERMFDFGSPESNLAASNMRIVDYVRMELPVAPDSRYYIWRPESQDLKETLEKLLSGYRP